MKITKKQCISGVFLLMMLVDMHFLYIFKYPDFLKNLLHRRIVPGTAGMLMFIYVICKYKKFINKYFSRLKIINYLVLLIFLILFFYTIIHYSAQPWNVTYLSTNNILIILWALPLAVSFRNTTTMRSYLRRINYILLLWFIIVAIQAVVYRVNGTLLFGFEDMFSGNIRVRNNGLRFELGGVSNIMILYNFDIILGKKEKKTILPCVVFVLGFLDVIFVQQTRMQIIALFCGLIMILLLGRKSKKQKIVSCVVLLFALLILLNTNYISQFVNSFSTTGEESGSTIIRLQEIEYYLDVFRKNIIFGLGGLSDAVGLYYSNLVHSSLGIYFLDDIGYLGTVANGGILLLIIVLTIILRWTKIIKKVIAKKKIQEYSYLIAIYVYILIAWITLPFILTQKTNIALPLVMAIFEIVVLNLEREKNI